MVFRLPSHLESLVPAPAQQHPQPSPWRGTFFVSGMRPSDRNSSQQLSVTAVETDGEKASQWPDSFHVRILYEQPVLRQFEVYMKSVLPSLPICTFMPNRLRDIDQHATNKVNFRSLSTYLYNNQTIAIASWAPNTFAGGGIVIYPAHNTNSVLIGAIFLDTAFPNFIGGFGGPITSGTPVGMQPSRHGQYHPRITTSGAYPSTSRHHAVPLSPHDSGPVSPIEQPIAAHHRQDAYRFMMSRAGHPAYGTEGQPSSDAWQSPTADDENNHSNAFPPSHNQPYP